MPEHEDHAHAAASRRVLRQRSGGEHARVSFYELFFDLVFVFAVTQLSHSLAGHLDARGATETVVMLLAVWWAWIYTTWATNWLDPDHVSVRLMLGGVMLAGLVMSAAIPEAFDGRAFAFAGPYVAIQVGRTAFLLWAMRGEEGRRQTFIGIIAWFLVSGLFWIGGSAADGDSRLALWFVALVIEYAGPSARYWLPVLGASRVSDWNVEGAHFAERCGLFIIIALGESLLITGATFSGLPWTEALVLALVASFGAAVAMWWVYFDLTAEAGSELIAHSDDPGRLARSAYTYLHLPMVMGIVLTAVGDEFVLAHPSDQPEFKVALVILGGPAVFLFGHWFFKRAISGRFVAAHPVAIVALIGSLAAQETLSTVALSVVATTILVVVAVWGRFQHRRGLEDAAV